MSTQQGNHFELEVMDTLKRYGYAVNRKQKVRVYENCRAWELDLWCKDGNSNVIIECKNQDSHGSTYEKIDLDCRKLTKISRHLKAKRAVMVYNGRELERFMTSNPLAQEIQRDYKNIDFMSYGELCMKLRINKRNWLFS